MPRPKHKSHFIYKTTNLNNGKYYIGMHSTSNFNDGYLGSGDRLRRSIRKYGRENFKLEILEFFNDRESLAKRERELINEEVIKDEMCMNLAYGGVGGILNEDHHEKMKKGASEWLKLMWKSKDYRDKFIEASSQRFTRLHKEGKIKYDTFINKTHSEETKRKIGNANTLKQSGSSNSQFGTRWITNGLENKKINKTDSPSKGWEFGRK